MHSPTLTGVQVAMASSLGQEEMSHYINTTKTKHSDGLLLTRASNAQCNCLCFKKAKLFQHLISCTLFMGLLVGLKSAGAMVFPHCSQ